MKYILIALAIALIFFTFIRKDYPIQTLHPSNTILAFGDSITYGYNAEPAQSYPSLLAKMTGLRVVNGGIPAETSGDGLKRLPQYLGDPSIKLMILCIGGNDVIQQIPMDRLKKNLKQMIQMAKAKNIDVMLISVPRFTPFGLSALHLYDEVANEENVPLISGLLSEILSEPSLKSDQIHPNAAGYRQMAQEIYQNLKAYGWIDK